MRKLCITLALALPLLVVSGSPAKSWRGGRGWGYPGYGYGWGYRPYYGRWRGWRYPIYGGYYGGYPFYPGYGYGYRFGW